MARDDAKPIRSLLYTPGDQEARIAQNAASGADALFLDLEEPRTPCTEETRIRARKLVREFLGAHKYGTGTAAFGGGRGHQGQDVFAECGTPLVAARGGVVKFKQYHARAGYYVVIDGARTGTDYAYMHL